MSEFGERLRQARIDRGMNQEELAGVMGLTQASISQFEKGLRMPTPANIRKFAQILNIHEEDLAGQNQGEFEKTLLMRNIRGLSPDSINKINEYAAMIKREEQTRNMSLRQSIAAHAAQLRENMAIGDSEIIGDIVDQIKEAGYHYMEDSFRDEFSGFSQALGHDSYVIGFNRDHLWSDKFHRFTLSHELGHITIPDHRQILETKGLHRSKSEFQSKDRIEREADYFAICFLAPKKAFQMAMKYKEYTKETILGLSEHFGISSYAAVLRFIELTDLACTLVVCNEEGAIEYEQRSNRMKETYKQDFLSKKQVKGTTLTYDYINGRQAEDVCTVSLDEWFDDLPIEIEATESVIELGYNGKFLTLLTPHIPDLDEFIAENESIGF